MIKNAKITHGLLGLGLAVASQAASATAINFGFGQSVVDAYNTAHGTSYSTGVSPGASYTDAASGVTASAYYLNSSNAWTSGSLWARNETNDNGLGVCSQGEGSYCVTGQGGNGDWNELSQEMNQEYIVLERPAGYSWSQLVASSLDNNNGAGPESGMLFWSDSSNDMNVNTFLSSLSSSSNHFTFQNGDFGSTSTVQGDVLATAAGQSSGFNPNAKFVAFRSGSLGGSTTSSSTYNSYKCKWKHNCTSTSSTTSTNNDYVVYGGALTSIPEPGTLALMGVGLAGLFMGRRRPKP